MIDVDGYTPNPTNTEWKRRIAGHHQGSNKNASQHAERSVFGSLPASVSAYLLVQNAFPCSLCHAWFTQQSAAYDIIIKITSDEGKYSLDHAAPGGKGPGTPHIIYDHGGTATHVGLSSGAGAGPPAGFAAHPDFTDL